MAAELNSITRNKIWELVDRSTGSEKKEEEDRVCVLHKTLYVLHQTPRAWNVKVDQVLKEMPKKFEMSDLGKLAYYLGIEVIQGADEIPCDIKMEACNTTYIPMEANLKISKPEDEREIDATEFTRNVGCLRYLLHTRPDLAYCIPRLIGYSDSSYNTDQDDGFMARTEAARQALWLKELLSEIIRAPCEKVTIRIGECVERELIEVEHVPGTEQKVDILTNVLGRIKFREMRDFIGIEDLKKRDFKFKRENVEIRLK
ncbi:uncharacterized protein LOC106447958 [Brassica napus]|uniref:uncharacterized protein LOC106447958 n=1 Tax=Brassica napus TaxID=3708 RepID=UPI002079DE5F|nr:uncharacterized protein LOC106447958 [Brassica napus]